MHPHPHSDMCVPHTAINSLFTSLSCCGFTLVPWANSRVVWFRGARGPCILSMPCHDETTKEILGLTWWHSVNRGSFFFYCGVGWEGEPFAILSVSVVGFASLGLKL